MKTNMRFCSALAQFFLEGEMLKTKVVEYIQTHFFFNNRFRNSCRL